MLTLNRFNLPDTAPSENAHTKKKQHCTYRQHQEQNRIYEDKKKKKNTQGKS